MELQKEIRGVNKKMINEYLKHIQEGYILSDKNISVDLDDFENGSKNKLIIIGVPGSGKTSLGEYLSKKYKVNDFISDTHWRKMRDGLTSSKRTIVEGAGLADLYYGEQTWRDLIIDKPMILMGMSAIKAGFRADKRDGTVPGKAKDWKDIYHFIRNNLSYWQKVINYLRKDVIKLPDAKIKEYKIPKFETVLH